MKNFFNPHVVTTAGVLALLACSTSAQDWPEWRGAGRNSKAAGFTAPKSWPKELTQTWKVDVGDGVATPSLVGDRLYVFAMQDGGEILRCLNAADGTEIWRDKYSALGASGPASGFAGPRCSPTVTEGKVVTLGVRGMLSCLDAAKGTVLWRKDDFKGATPRFQTSSSPLVEGGLCVAQLGAAENGGIVAYDLASGDEKWRWSGDGPSYASPVLMIVGDVKHVVAATDKKIVVLTLQDGKVAWETDFVVQGRGYNATTPVVEGQTMIYTGSNRGATAVKFSMDGGTLVAKELWKNPDNSVAFNSPVLKGGLLYAISGKNDFFCVNAGDGKTLWAAPFSKAAAAADVSTTTRPAEGTAPAPTNPPAGAPQISAAVTNVETAGGSNRVETAGRPGEPGGGRGGRGGRGGGMGYGSIVDAGSVLLALTPASQLVVFEPGAKEFKEVARIKVADSPIYAYPVVSGNRIFVKDQNSLRLLMVPAETGK